jgi:hypothetical protein
MDDGKILLFDLSGLAPETMLILGQMLLAKFQVELMRREALIEEERVPFYLYADEFQTFASAAEGSWRQLLARGRRFGLAFTLAHQAPSQIPQALCSEIVGNAASLVMFNMSAKDAEGMRKEFFDLPVVPEPASPVSVEAFVTLKTGQAIARLGTGAYAVRLQTAAPVDREPAWRGEQASAQSWERYGYLRVNADPERLRRRRTDVKARDFLE